MTDNFWNVIDTQREQLRSAESAADVLRILATEHNPYGPGIASAPAFFAGDRSMREELVEAGWTTIWSEAWYHFAMRAPDGTVITYVEGDIYPENRPPWHRHEVGL